MCTASAPWVHVPTLATLAQGYIRHMRSGKIGAIALVILLGLVVGVLGLVVPSLYTVGVLVLFIGGIGVAVVVGEFLIRNLGRRPPA
jgi:hypothetical protein